MSAFGVPGRMAAKASDFRMPGTRKMRAHFQDSIAVTTVLEGNAIAAYTNRVPVMYESLTLLDEPDQANPVAVFLPVF